MECFPCLQAGVARPAAALCHHRSAGICREHIFEVEDPILIEHVLVPTLVLPKKARVLYCRTCRDALQQPEVDGLKLAS
jgi:hypothetical protein